MILGLLLLAVACGSPVEPPASWPEAELAADRLAWDDDASEMNGIWVGRRLGYLGRYDEAIDWYRQRLEEFPKSYRLRRHLGHRLITVRKFDEAIDVLEQARALAASHRNYLESDGAPNPTGEPRSTTHGNIDYHLGLAYYLVGEFDRAAESWSRCVQQWAKNDDGRVSAGHWWYTSLVRAGRFDEAAAVLELLPSDPDVIENHAYRNLIDLYAGRRGSDEPDADGETPTGAAWQYGLARWQIADGDVESGTAILEALATSDNRASFGVIAAEADLNADP